MEDDYLAGMFPALYRMRQAHQRLTALTDAEEGDPGERSEEEEDPEELPFP